MTNPRVQLLRDAADDSIEAANSLLASDRSSAANECSARARELRDWADELERPPAMREFLALVGHCSNCSCEDCLAFFSKYSSGLPREPKGDCVEWIVCECGTVHHAGLGCCLKVIHCQCGKTTSVELPAGTYVGKPVRVAEPSAERQGMAFGCSGCGAAVTLAFTDSTKKYVDIKSISGWTAGVGGTWCPKCTFSKNRRAEPT